jgi:hypothetical protein
MVLHADERIRIIDSVSLNSRLESNKEEEEEEEKGERIKEEEEEEEDERSRNDPWCRDCMRTNGPG